MQIILVRHGQAGPYCADDAGRQLTEFGRLQAAQTAQFIAEKYQPDVVIASPYCRAEQTAQIIFDQLNQAQKPASFVTISSITPDDDPQIGLDDIECAVRHKFTQQADDFTVIVVCHMPIVARMASILDGLPPADYALAECRVYQAAVIGADLATQTASFVPVQPD